MIKLRRCGVLGCASLIPRWRPGCWRHVLAHGAALCALLTLGCGSITLAPADQLGPDAGILEGVADSAAREAPYMAEARPAAASDDAGPDFETPAARPSCAEACGACPGYPCAAVIACVRSGDGGAYPWQSCHNEIAGVGASVDGLHCAMLLACQ